MIHSLSFSTLHRYETSLPGIVVPVELQIADRRVKIPDTRLDTGATHCIFKKEYGELLGLDVEAGVEERFGTASGPFIGFGHELTLCALGFEFAAIVYFADLKYPRNVLGRFGWLQQMRIGIIDYDGKLFVSRYDED